MLSCLSRKKSSLDDDSDIEGKEKPTSGTRDFVFQKNPYVLISFMWCAVYMNGFSLLSAWLSVKLRNTCVFGVAGHSNAIENQNVVINAKQIQPADMNCMCMYVCV